MQVQQDAGSSTKALTVGARPAGEVQRLKSERVQLRVGEVPAEQPLSYPILRGRLSLGSLISLSFELDGGAFCLAESEEPEGEGDGVPSAPSAGSPGAAAALKEGDRARI